MSFDTIEVSIKGVSPLILHNGQLANPMNKWAKAIKEISGRRKKTDEDFEEMARLEFMGSFYVNEKNVVVVPGVNIEAMLIAAAKQVRMGPKAKSGIVCDKDWPLLFDGPNKLEAMWKSGKFTDQRLVRVQQARIVRTRPIFYQWALDFQIGYMPDILNLGDLKGFLKDASYRIGLGDFRPKFGRFEIVKC